MPETILLNIDDQIATITFNRPDAMNSYNKAMAVEMAAATDEVRNNTKIRAVILNGAGKLFMPGGDLRFFYETLDTMPEGVDTIVGLLHRSVLNLMQMEKPVLASVHGSVAGAGISLMLACDLVIAAENTKFTLAYSGIGTSPDGGATYNLPRLVGSKKAMELLLFNEIFDAKTALAYGMINWIVSETELSERTSQLAKKLANGPTISFAHIKRLVNQTWQNPLNQQLDEEEKAFVNCTSTKDFNTGVSSFLGKKQPVFTGK